MPKYEAWSAERAVEVIQPCADLEGPLLPMLHALQHTFGHVPDAAVPLLAGLLNLSRADVHGVVTFYHDFRHHPAGRRVLKVCRAEACQARGGNAVAEAAEQALGIKFGQTTRDGATTLEAIYCLGLCASGPAAMLDDRLAARLDVPAIERLAAEARA